MNDIAPETIPAILDRTAAARVSDPAILRLDADGADPLTWGGLAGRIEAFAAALAGLGVRPEDRVAHLAENRWEWIVTDLALHAARAVHVPIHVSLSTEQVAYQVRHSGARVLIASRSDLVAGVPRQCAGLEAVVLYEFAANEPADAGRVKVYAFGSLIEEFSSQATGQLLGEAAQQTQPDELATILYTSGTTGEPKGVMLSQRNLATNAVATCRAVGSSDDDLRLCFLPLSHIYARTCDLYTWVERGSRLALARGRETVVEDCQRVQPTLLNGVPYFYQKLHDKLLAAGKVDQPGTLQAVLGGRIEYCFCGGAALPEPVAEFFERQEVCILPGYGLTESSPVIAASRPMARRRGTVGPPIDGVEVRIADDGEILTRGPHVMLGYWQDDAATREAIKDGWLHTGDLGEIGADGYLAIRGRKKEIIVLSTGKNVSPALVEGLLTSSPLIEQALVVGDDHKYVAALIVPNPEALKAEIIKRRIPVFTPAQALAHKRVAALYQEEIDRVLAPLATYERVCRFKLLDRGFSIEKGELTAKLSLRREVLAEHFREEIEELY
jgi:long-chain acyl-CoA synthetase